MGRIVIIAMLQARRASGRQEQGRIEETQRGFTEDDM